MSYDAEAFDAYEAAGWAAKEVSVYDTLAGRVTSRLAEPLLNAVGAGPGTRLLDVATGPGSDGDGFAVPVAVKLGSGRKQ